MKINVFCLDWHITSSDAFKLLLSEPLKDSLDLEFIPWDGVNLPRPLSTKSPTVFAMLPPTEKILRQSKAPLIWVPMWDQAQGYDDDWWRQLSQHDNLKILAYSDAIAKSSQRFNIPTLHLKYFCNPADYKSVSWKNGNVLYYWNRVGLAGPDFIKRICHELKITKLLFKPDLDPRIDESLYYQLPKNLSGTEVVTINNIRSKSKYLDIISSANIFIAPRLTEGVGVAFLEMMARGGLVIGHNAPTMNEYIENGVSGLLIERNEISYSTKIKNLLNIDQSTDSSPFLISASRQWKRLGKIDPSVYGDNARLQHQDGYSTWQEHQKQIASYILNR